MTVKAMGVVGMVQEEYKETLSLKNRIMSFNIYMPKKERKS